MRWIIIVLLTANISYFIWGMAWQSQPVSTQQQQATTPTDEAGKRLLLLSESHLGQHAQPQTNTNASNPAKVQQGTCLWIGPFLSSTTADQVQQWLFTNNIASSERLAEAVVEHWVHIPPLASRNDAIGLLRKLQAQGIDSFVITQGELTNGISLGLFKNEILAQQLHRRLTNAGYRPAIKALQRQPTRWWLELQHEAAVQLDTAVWNAMTQAFADLDDLQKITKPCDGKTP